MALTEKKMFDHKGGFELDDLRGEKLHMVCLKGAELHGVDARDTSLVHVNFVHSKWNHIFFSNVHVNEVQMGGTLFENIRRPDAEVSRFEEEAGTDGWINVEPVRFLTSDLSKAVFKSCNLKDVELIDCQVEGMRINGIPVEELLRSYSEKQKYPHVIEQFRQLREETLALLADIRPEWYDIMPEGFNNSIRWNLGHILVAWDHAIFPKLGEEWHVPSHYHYLFPKGSSPKTWQTAAPAVEEIVNHLRSQKDEISDATAHRLSELLVEPFLKIATIQEMYGFMLREETHHMNVIKRIAEAIRATTTEAAGQDLPTAVTIPPISIVGVTFDANLTEIEQQQLGAAALEKARAYKERIPTRLSDDVHLIQLYPMKPNFNPHVDAFTQIIGYLVPEATTPPEELVLRSFPEREYVKVTHKGLESELGRTYDLLYGQWMQENGRQPAGYDFEVWGERYKPDQEDNEIDVHVALAP
ncbi:MAG: DinB family protein [Bacillota bacterium]